MPIPSEQTPKAKGRNWNTRWKEGIWKSDKNRKNLLHLAVSQRSPEILNLLLDIIKKDPDAFSSLFIQNDKDSKTPLALALDHASGLITRQLLKAMITCLGIEAVARVCEMITSPDSTDLINNTLNALTKYEIFSAEEYETFVEEVLTTDVFLFRFMVKIMPELITVVNAEQRNLFHRLLLEDYNEYTRHSINLKLHALGRSDSGRYGINQRDQTGLTPLHIAAGKNNLNGICILLKYGAWPGYRDHSGKLPRQYVRIMSVNEDPRFKWGKCREALDKALNQPKYSRRKIAFFKDPENLHLRSLGLNRLLSRKKRKYGEETEIFHNKLRKK